MTIFEFLSGAARTWIISSYFGGVDNRLMTTLLALLSGCGLTLCVSSRILFLACLIAAVVVRPIGHGFTHLRLAGSLTLRAQLGVRSAGCLRLRNEYLTSHKRRYRFDIEGIHGVLE